MTMNNYQKALNNLVGYRTGFRGGKTIIQEDINKLQELVNKVTPKKPLKNRYDYLICPICTNEVENERGHVFKYCPHCGQRLE